MMPFDSLKFKLLEDIDATQKALIKKGLVTKEDIDNEKKNQK